MSSSSLVDSLKYSSQQILVYFGFFVVITGLIGNVFNIIIFTSLKTFRETTCAFYLTIASLVNIFQLLAGLLFRILSNVYNIDGTKTSIFLCKTRMSILLAAVLISLTCMCFAAADQYASITARWKHLSQKHLAYWFMWNFEYNLYCVLYSSCYSNSIWFFTSADSVLFWFIGFY